MPAATRIHTARLARRAALCALAAAALAVGLGTSRAAATSTSAVGFTGVNATCAGLAVPVAGGDLVLQTQIDEHTSVGVVPKAVRELYGASPTLANPYAGGQIPVRASLTWTVMSATGRDGAGHLFTVTGRFARLDPRVYTDDFVGIGSLRITRDDHSMLKSDSSVSYLGSRVGGWNVNVTEGRCGGSKP